MTADDIPVLHLGIPHHDSKACAAGLVDFGQCKQLPRESQLAFAELLVNLAAAQGAELNEVLSALSLPEQAAISASLTRLGIETGDGPTGTRVRLAYGMFDSRGRYFSACNHHRTV